MSTRFSRLALHGLTPGHSNRMPVEDPDRHPRGARRTVARPSWGAGASWSRPMRHRFAYVLVGPERPGLSTP